MFWKKFKATWWPEILLLTVISALVYLSQVGKLSFHSDDWYFIYNGLVNGPRAFIDIALHTRPIRGPLYEFLFTYFGVNPLPYNLTLYVFRLLGGFGALWLFNLLWPKQRQGNFFLATLFLLFPGFLWWVSGFEFQPYVLSLTLQVFSIVFTLKAIAAKTWPARIAWAVAAILGGWVYLALVEFAVGMEGFRILAVFLFLKHAHALESFKNLCLRTLRASALYLVIPFGFVFWYQFIFDNWRKAQQADVQLGRVLAEPLTLMTWVVHFFQGFLNVSLFSWVAPFNGSFYSGQPRDFIFRFAIAAAVIALGALAFFWLGKTAQGAEGEAEAEQPGAWQIELVVVGFLGTLGGILPVVVANRTVIFKFSQYLLPASLAGILFLGGLAFAISQKQIRFVALALLLGLATLTHQAVAYNAATEEQTIYDFWWQMTWRAPSIRAGSTLLASYPFDIGDGDSLIWGPASFIYYPQTQNQSPVVLQLSSLTQQPETIGDIMVGGAVDEVDRTITNAKFHYDYDNLLVMAQPRSDACVRVLNPEWPEFSTADNGLTLVSAPYSNLETILPDAQPATPPQPPFPAEPAHGWCYYYQKADLARQQGNWPEVARLGDEARQQKLAPNDAIEWLPFAQAYAFTGEIKSLGAVAKFIKKEPFYQKQACQNLLKMDTETPLPPPALDEAKRLFCTVE